MLREGLDCILNDSRSIEKTLNPSYYFEATGERQMGYISFWQNGFCDYQVFNTDDGSVVVSQGSLEVNDTNAQTLFEAFSNALKS